MFNSEAVTYSMLKEIWIQVFVKTIGKINAGLLPLCLTYHQKASVFTDKTTVRNAGITNVV